MKLEVANFGRDQLAQLLHQINAVQAVEVGVADGVYSRILMEENPQMILYGVDPYLPYRGYRDFTKESTFSGMEQHARDALAPYADRYTFIREMSMDALRHFEDNSLDFVYLDGNHADPYVTQDIEAWHKKVRPGGILAGHDYFRTNQAGGDFAVIDAVHKFSEANNLVLFILGTNAIRPGEVRDKSRSWMWFKT